MQGLLAQLIEDKWTKAAIADALTVNYSTLGRWIRGEIVPRNERGVVLQLRELRRRRVPPKRRETKSSPAT